MISLRTQVERHRADELDWPTIWLAEMVRQESHPFFLRLLEGETLDDLAGIGYRINTRSSKRRGASEPSENSDIKKLIEEVGDIPAVKPGRLIELIKATRSVAGMQLLYNWRFAFRPEAITWKEFEGILVRWNIWFLPGHWRATDRTDLPSLKPRRLLSRCTQIPDFQKDGHFTAVKIDNFTFKSICSSCNNGTTRGRSEAAPLATH
jgi:hypothetical protein